MPYIDGFVIAVPTAKKQAFIDHAKMQDPETMKDPRMDPAKNPPPFDGKRMIFGGFSPIVELGE